MDYSEFSEKIIRLKARDEKLRKELIQKGQLSNGYNREMEKVHKNLNLIINIRLRIAEMCEIWAENIARIVGYFKSFSAQRLGISAISFGFCKFLHKSLHIFLNYLDSPSKICINFFKKLTETEAKFIINFRLIVMPPNLTG